MPTLLQNQLTVAFGLNYNNKTIMTAQLKHQLTMFLGIEYNNENLMPMQLQRA